MNHFLSFLLLVVVLTTAAFAAPNSDPGKPGFPSPTAQRDYLNKGYGFSPQLGSEVADHKVHVAKGSWSVVKNGGASVVLPSAIVANLVDVDGKDLQLPYHAVVKQVTVDVITPLAASTDPIYSGAKLGLGLNTPGDLKAYLAAASWTGLLGGVPDGTLTNMVKVGSAAKSNTAGSTVKLNLKGGSVVQGQLNVFIEYYLSD